MPAEMTAGIAIASQERTAAELLEVPLRVTRMKPRERVLKGHFGLQPRPFEQMTWGPAAD